MTRGYAVRAAYAVTGGGLGRRRSPWCGGRGARGHQTGHVRVEAVALGRGQASSMARVGRCERVRPMPLSAASRRSARRHTHLGPISSSTASKPAATAPVDEIALVEVDHRPRGPGGAVAVDGADLQHQVVDRRVAEAERPPRPVLQQETVDRLEHRQPPARPQHPGDLGGAQILVPRCRRSELRRTRTPQGGRVTEFFRCCGGRAAVDVRADQPFSCWSTGRGGRSASATRRSTTWC